MQMSQFIQAICKHSGSSEKAARRAATKTLEVFGELLTDTDRKAVSRQLPSELADAIATGRSGREFGIDEFYERINVRKGAARGFQIEHAQAVCAALADALDYETRIRLQNHLSEEFARLLEPRDIPGVQNGSRRETSHSGRKLSTGRPGSTNPINEAGGIAHRNSVARFTTDGD